MRFSYLVISFLLALGAAQDLQPEQQCADCAWEILGQVPFEGDPTDEADTAYYEAVCKNPLKLISIYATAKTYCTPAEVEAGFKALESNCMVYGEGIVLTPMSEFEANLTDEKIKSYPVVETSELNPEEPVASPLVVGRATFDSMYRTVDVWEFELRSHT